MNTKLLMYPFLVFSFLYHFNLLSQAQQPNLDNQMEECNAQDTMNLAQESNWISQFYNLKEDEQIREITSDLLKDPKVTEKFKQNMLENNRRAFVFWYPSDGLKVKGFITFSGNATGNPLLILLRGGNREWGILNPAGDLANIKNYTIISTAYRGGISEGQEEFGGSDVNDVKNLMEFIPTLEKQLGMSFQPSQTSILGASRGGMEMFLSLARYPELQKHIDKIVSLSGLLDIRTQMRNREEMKKMFEEDFGLNSGINDKEWINRRDPLLTVATIKKDIPILIIQGTEDDRISLEEGQHMVQKLKENGNNVDYLEIQGGSHTLYGHPDRIKVITDWLELNS